MALRKEIRAALIAAARVGLPEKECAWKAGISPNTLREWLRRGNGEDPDRPPTPAMEEFAIEWAQAVTVYLESHLQTINEAATGIDEVTDESVTEDGPDGARTTSRRRVTRKRDWKAAAFALERRFPEQFAAQAKRPIDPNANGDAGARRILVLGAFPTSVVQLPREAEAEVASGPSRKPVVRLARHVTDEEPPTAEQLMGGA